jgi:exonuclease III
MNILCWNVRGLNDKDKWGLLRNKIEECGVNIFCFQETKSDHIDIRFLKNFAPKRFDKFEFCPSSGASGGILVAWVSRFFSVTVLEKHPFAIRLTFTYAINSISWNLVVVYGPCRQPDRDEFVNWLYNLDIDEEDLWLFMGVSTSTGMLKIEIDRVEILMTLCFLTTS